MKDIISIAESVDVAYDIHPVRRYWQQHDRDFFAEDILQYVNAISSSAISERVANSFSISLSKADVEDTYMGFLRDHIFRYSPSGWITCTLRSVSDNHMVVRFWKDDREEDI
jgi:hypothetical protein